MESLSTAQSWSAGQKILFRFFAAYFAFYFLSFAVDIITSLGGASLNTAFEHFYMWIAKHVFHMTRTIRIDDNGSGDTSFGYVQQFLVISFAVIAGTVWTIADRTRSNYDWLLDRVKIISHFFVRMGF